MQFQPEARSQSAVKPTDHHDLGGPSVRQGPARDRHLVVGAEQGDHLPGDAQDRRRILLAIAGVAGWAGADDLDQRPAAPLVPDIHHGDAPASRARRGDDLDSLVGDALAGDSGLTEQAQAGALGGPRPGRRARG